jgi:2-methylcitrate dehydratase PrpD
MGTTQGPTDRLAAFVASCNELAVSDDLALRAGTAMLDAFGLALAARGLITMEAYISITKQLKNPDEGCTIWGRPGRVSILDGVTANSLSVHARFQDDCDMTSWAHPGSLIVPPAVSLGELEDVKVATVIRAILCGYATISWLGGEEVVGRSVVRRGFRASPVFGSIGAAAAASVVLGLDEGRARNAIAIAADNTGGILEPVGAGADDWRVQNGTAGHRGVLSAMLAQRGVVGAPRALEGPNGLLRTFAGLDEVPEVWERDPDVRSILTVWAKPYPTLGDNVAVVSAALALREAGLDPGTIASVEVHQNAHFASYPGTSFRGPYERPAQAVASTAYAVASTLLYGRLDYARYTTRLHDAPTMALIEHLSVVPEATYSYVDGMVAVTLQDGSRRTQAAKDLDQTLFYRNRASALDAFGSLLHETGYGPELVSSVSSTVFNAIENPDTTTIRTVVESLGTDR